jgi:peptidoglycan/xylan/chitin deacetylase (PgdA/CDA1 family)
MHDERTPIPRWSPRGWGQAGSRPLSAAVFLRRRRAAALGAIAFVAVLALVAGIAVGSGGGVRASPRALAAPAPLGFFAAVHALAGTGHDSFQARELAAENAAVNRTLGYTPFVRIAGSAKREIALTFDDGPGPYTPAILAALERAHAPATFFEVGFMLRWFHDSTSAIVARGDPIGDHTALHPPMSQLSLGAQRGELLDQAATISQYGAPFPRLFRPPYGVYDDKTLSLLHKYGMLMVMWTVDSEDYLRPGVTAIVHRVLAGARPGAIILLHDAGGNRQQTVDAVPKIVRGLRARGYRLVTVPRLLLDDPAPRDQDVVASSSLGAG